MAEVTPEQNSRNYPLYQQAQFAILSANSAAATETFHLRQILSLQEAIRALEDVNTGQPLEAPGNPLANLSLLQSGNDPKFALLRLQQELINQEAYANHWRQVSEIYLKQVVENPIVRGIYQSKEELFQGESFYKIEFKK